MDKVTTVARVAHEFEAVSIIAALSDAGINAAKQQAAVSNPLSLPGAMGIPENGYDVLVSEEDAARALEVLLGMGYGDAADDDSNEEGISDDAAESSDVSEKAADEDLESGDTEKEINPILLAVLKVLGAVLILAAIAAFVWLSDYLISLVKALF